MLTQRWGQTMFSYFSYGEKQIFLLKGAMTQTPPKYATVNEFIRAICDGDSFQVIYFGGHIEPLPVA